MIDDYILTSSFQISITHYNSKSLSTQNNMNPQTTYHSYYDVCSNFFFLHSGSVFISPLLEKITATTLKLNVYPLPVAFLCFITAPIKKSIYPTLSSRAVLKRVNIFPWVHLMIIFNIFYNLHTSSPA